MRAWLSLFTRSKMSLSTLRAHPERGRGGVGENVRDRANTTGRGGARGMCSDLLVWAWRGAWSEGIQF